MNQTEQTSTPAPDETVSDTIVTEMTVKDAAKMYPDGQSKSVPDNGDQLLYLLPEDINIPPELDVRPWSNRMGPTEKETQALNELVESIKAEGQLEPIKVRYNGNDGYDVVIGRRRITAVMMINAAKSAKETPLRVTAIVTKENETNEKKLQSHAYRQAIMENIHRENLSPMDMAEDINTAPG